MLNFWKRKKSSKKKKLFERKKLLPKINSTFLNRIFISKIGFPSILNSQISKPFFYTINQPFSYHFYKLLEKTLIS